MQRRLYDPSAYEFLQHLLPWNQWISRAAYVLGAAQLVFVWNFFVQPAPRQAGAGEPVGGRHARVDAAVAAAAPQLRRHPDRRARPARARPPRRARARQGLAGAGRGAVVSPRGLRGAANDANGAVGMAGVPGRVRDAVRGAAVRVRGRARAGVGVAAARDAAVSARRRRQQRPAADRGRLRAAARARRAVRRGPPARSGWARCSWSMQAALWGRLVAGHLGPGDGRARRRVLRAVGVPRAARAGRPGRDRRPAAAAGEPRRPPAAAAARDDSTWTSSPSSG